MSSAQNQIGRQGIVTAEKLISNGFSYNLSNFPPNLLNLQVRELHPIYSSKWRLPQFSMARTCILAGG